MPPLPPGGPGSGAPDAVGATAPASGLAHWDRQDLVSDAVSAPEEWARESPGNACLAGWGASEAGAQWASGGAGLAVSCALSALGAREELDEVGVGAAVTAPLPLPLQP